jgi:hypothetical protein
VAGLESLKSLSSPKRLGQTTPTAKRKLNMRHLALGFTVFMDRVTGKAKPEPINSREATRICMATYVRSFSTTAAAFSLCPSSASPRFGCVQVQRHCSSSRESKYDVHFHKVCTSSKVMPRSKIVLVTREYLIDKYWIFDSSFSPPASTTDT